MAGRIEARLKELGIVLPEAAAPMANYVPFVLAGNLVVISGRCRSRTAGSPSPARWAPA